MYTDNTNIELYDLLELINETLSYSFVEKWRYKYSEKFIKHFQLKLLEQMTKRRPIKRERMFNYMVKKCKYSTDQVENFFESIEIEMYSPIIT